MLKPISNFYTVVWVEVPDEPTPRRPRGTRARARFAIQRLRDAKARLTRAIRGSRLAGGLAGGLAGALATLALVFTRG